MEKMKKREDAVCDVRTIQHVFFFFDGGTIQHVIISKMLPNILRRIGPKWASRHNLPKGLAIDIKSSSLYSAFVG